MTPCVACNGTGRASNGAQCYPCQGSGHVANALAVDLTPYRAAAGDMIAAKTMADQSLDYIQGLQVNDDAAFNQLGEWVKQVKALGAKYEDQRTSITKPLNDAKRAVDALFKPITSAYDRAEQLLKGKLLAYQAHQLQERARIAQAMAVEHQQGNVGGVMALAVQAHATTPPAIEGIQQRKVRRWRVVDAGAIPRAYWALDEGAITAAMREGTPVPGVEYYEEATLAVSAG